MIFPSLGEQVSGKENVPLQKYFETQTIACPEFIEQFGSKYKYKRRFYLLRERVIGNLSRTIGLSSRYTFGGPMFKSIIVNAVVAVTTAALAATLTIFVTTGAIPEAKAHSQDLMLPAPAPAMADRLPAIVQGGKGNACSSRGWPHYEQNCLFDLRTSANEARTVRLVVLR